MRSANVSYLNRNYCHKSLIIQISHDAWWTLFIKNFPSLEIEPAPHPHSSNLKHDILNHTST